MSNCELCGEPMPKGEEMFKFHGYSGPCPKPPMPRPPSEIDRLRAALAAHDRRIEALCNAINRVRFFDLSDGVRRILVDALAADDEAAKEKPHG